MPLAFQDEPESNPAEDTRDAIVDQINKIFRGLEAVAADKTYSAQLISRLNHIRVSLPQFRTNLDGLRRLQSALRDADQRLSLLREMTPLARSLRRDLARSIFEEISLNLDDTLIFITYGQELEELARVEQEDLKDVAQIFVPSWPSRTRPPSAASSRESGPDIPGGHSTSREIPHHAEDSTRDLLQKVLQREQSGATLFTVEELCDKIRSAPELSSILIGDLFRRKIPTGVQHEFVVIKSVPIAGHSVWIRVDRAAKGYRIWNIKAKYPANDTARMEGDDGQQYIFGRSRLRAHVTFGANSTQPKFLTLADLITIMREESREYRLLSENCYFFTSVIQEILTDHCGGNLVSGTLGHKALGTKVRQRVQRRFTRSEPEVTSPTTMDEPPTRAPSAPKESNRLWGIARSLPKAIKLISNAQTQRSRC